MFVFQAIHTSHTCPSRATVSTPHTFSFFSTPSLVATFEKSNQG